MKQANLDVRQVRVRDLKSGDRLASGPTVVTTSQVSSAKILVVTTADGTRLDADKFVWIKKEGC